MQKLRTVKTGANAVWSADTLRGWFSDPHLFAARRLLSGASGTVEASMSSAVLSIRVVANRTHFASVRLSGLNERARNVTGSCTCGATGVCEHMVAGFLLHTAQQRQIPVDVVLSEIIGSGTSDALLAEGRQDDDQPFRTALNQWLKAAPSVDQEKKEGAAAEAMVFLEASRPKAFVLDRVGIETRDGTKRNFEALAAAAGNGGLPFSVQRGAALLLAEGAGRSGETWGPQAANACLDLARAGHLRMFGSTTPLRPAEPFAARLQWRVEGMTAFLDVVLPEGTAHVVDAKPGLYVTEEGDIGILEGIPPRVVDWGRKAPAVPVGALASFRAALAKNADAAAYIPEPPEPQVERAPGERAVPIVSLRGQGSTARVELSFDYGGGMEVTEPGRSGEVRKLVAGKWMVARRDTDLEKACVTRLTNGGLKQSDFRRWCFQIPALFAHVTAHEWQVLQRGLIRDLEFEDWIVRIDEDFGFRPDVVARKGSAEAEQRFNRKGRAVA
jgi:hypothetical protein